MVVQILTWLAVIAGFYMAWNIGANDVANAMGTSVGSKALTLRRAVILAALLEFSGAVFLGSSVSETIQHEIVDPSLFAQAPMHFALGMLSALLSTGILLQVASYFGLPVSTTHAIIGAVFGFGLIVGGVESVHWSVVQNIAASWVLSPILSGIVAYVTFSTIQKRIFYAYDPIDAAQQIAPIFIFLCIALVSGSLFLEGFAPLSLFISLPLALILACGCGSLAGLVGRYLIRKYSSPALQMAGGFHPIQAVSLEKAHQHLQRVYLSNRNQAVHDRLASLLVGVRILTEEARKAAPFTHVGYAGVEKIFVYLQIMSACLVALAHGANDVANAIGPMSAVLETLKHGVLNEVTPIPMWLLVLGGSGIVLGLATWGWRVIETIGSKITELTPTRGFSAEFATALTVLVASKLGLPISTTHALVGAVFGVGMARGLRALNLRIARDILISWVATVPLCGGICVIVFLTLKGFNCFL